MPASKDALPTRIIIRSIFGEANWCGPFVRNQQPAKRVAGPLRVICVIAIAGQNPGMDAVPNNGQKIQRSGVQGKLVLLCNRGVRPRTLLSRSEISDVSLA